MAKPKRRKASLHSAGRTVEAEIIANAKALRDRPELAVPRCEGGCVLLSPFERARRANARVVAAKDDPVALARLAKRGPRLSRALAATYLVARETKLPYVAEVRLPGRSVSFAQRGKAYPFELAGLQHIDDPESRLLAASHSVKKRGVHVWSVGEGMVCTGKSPTPPAEFVREELDALGLVARSSDRWTCAHGGAEDGDALVLHWTAAKVVAERCAECADDSNSLHEILKHVAARDATRLIRPEARLAPLDGAGAPAAPGAPEDAAREYAKGALTDAAFLERARAARTSALRALGRRAFVDALAPTPVERVALDAALAGLDRPVVVDRASAVRALAEVWRERGREALRAAAAGDRATADALHDPDATPDDVADALRKAAERGARSRVESELPRFRRLPDAASVADAIARAHRSGGREAAARVAKDTSTGRARGVAFAFLRALGAAEGQDWKFSASDREIADAILADAKRLLECPPTEYAEVLARIATMAGATEPVEPA